MTEVAKIKTNQFKLSICKLQMNMTDCRTHKNWPLIVLAEYEDSTIGDIYPHLAECGILKIIITITF